VEEVHNCNAALRGEGSYVEECQLREFTAITVKSWPKVDLVARGTETLAFLPLWKAASLIIPFVISSPAIGVLACGDDLPVAIWPW